MFFLLRLAGSAVVLALAAPESRLVLEADVSAAVGHSPTWSRGDRAQQSDTIRPIFMLKHGEDRLASFERILLDVSTPGNALYGKHLSRTEVAKRLPPVDGAREAVLALLAEHGITSDMMDMGNDMIAATMTVQQAEEMFETQLHYFNHQTLDVNLIRAVTPYTLPASVASAIYLVGNLLQLPALSGPQSVADESPFVFANSTGGVDDFPNGCGPKCAGKVTPDVLRQAYRFDDSPTGGNTTMAVAEFQGVSWTEKDDDYFNSQCKPKMPVKVDRQVGKNPQVVCKVPLFGGLLCTEALLDIQYIKSVAGDVPLTCISNMKFSLLNWAEQLDKMEDVPLVHSVSYGNDEVQQSSAAFMQAVNAQFMKLGARGISVLVASGDMGVYGRTGPTGDSKFHPDFPASSPYVTAVGGTDFAQKSVVGAEKAWAASGGGFSNAFTAPAYQKDTVTGYLSALSAAGEAPKSAHFNSKGRGYPDISALAGQQNPYCIASSGFLGFRSSMSGVAGTSASCPVVAGLFARLNAQRAKEGKAPMGFLNPFIYQNPHAFNDVVLGKNQGSGSEGFAAIKGWDASTGFGTPNFPKLKVAAMAAVSMAESVQEVVV